MASNPQLQNETQLISRADEIEDENDKGDNDKIRIGRMFRDIVYTMFRVTQAEAIRDALKELTGNNRLPASAIAGVVVTEPGDPGDPIIVGGGKTTLIPADAGRVFSQQDSGRVFDYFDFENLNIALPNTDAENKLDASFYVGIANESTAGRIVIQRGASVVIIDETGNQINAVNPKKSGAIFARGANEYYAKGETGAFAFVTTTDPGDPGEPGEGSSIVAINFTNAGLDWPEANNIYDYSTGVFVPLVDTNSQASGLNMAFLTSGFAGNNTANGHNQVVDVFPASAARAYFYTGSGAEQQVKITGAVNGRAYQVKVLSSRANATGIRTMNVTIGGATQTLDALAPSVGVFNNIVPSNGEILIKTNQPTSGSQMHLNAIMISW